MTREESDDEIDERIRNEVHPDAYTQYEQEIGWWYYLERKLTFPFQARCLEERPISPLEMGEVVRVVGVIDEVVSEMLVRIEWRDRDMGVPLSQLEPIDPDTVTKEAIQDWHYWESS